MYNLASKKLWFSLFVLEAYLQKTIKIMGLNIKYLCMSVYYNQLNIRFYILQTKIRVGKMW